MMRFMDVLNEALYQGRKVTLNKPVRNPSGSRKKSSVFIKHGDRVKKVQFGDPNMSIKKTDPDRRRSFRARHNCDSATDKSTPRYWSCKAW